MGSIKSGNRIKGQFREGQNRVLGKSIHPYHLGSVRRIGRPRGRRIGAR